MYNYIVIKIFLVKHKRILSITLAVLFLVVLFLLKDTSIFKNTINFSAQSNQSNSLAYDSNITMGELINKDTDGDGIPDWEESLYGLDPTKKETVPGTPDSTTINKLRGEQDTVNVNTQDTTNLTQTEKFARELFSTAASVSQNGTYNQALTEQIGSSLADKIKNNTPKKVFTLSDLKITENTLPSTYINYSDNVMNIWKQNKKYDYTVTEVLERFVGDQKNIDVAALKDLDPIIESVNKINAAMVKMTVPHAFAYQHLDFLNGAERVVENLSDLRSYENDPIVALSGMNQYVKNLELYLKAVQNLTDTVNQKTGRK